MIDFTNMPVKMKTYSGANGSKICVLYDDGLYMLKFPTPPTRNDNISYTNSCVSEYIGCQIFKSIGLPVQETLLGTYRKNGKEKIVVACKDFTSPGIVLQDFASVKNTIIDSARNGYGTELIDIEKTIDEHIFIQSEEVRERFWDMFIVDALRTQAGILGNSIAEMKAFFATISNIWLRFLYFMLYYMYERKSYPLQNFCV